ncbi:MAG: hypothetical protein AB1679_18790 [Actinomycetota bacterium]
MNVVALARPFTGQPGCRTVTPSEAEPTGTILTLPAEGADGPAPAPIIGTSR